MPALTEDETLAPQVDVLLSMFEGLPTSLLVLLSRVVAQTGDSVIITDSEGTICYVNPGFEATSGYSQAEALGKTPRILKSGLHDAEFYRQLWSRPSKDSQIAAW
jgi:PAS domain S-box-containing protein